MKIGPTIDQRIKLLIEEESDFHLLTQIIIDSSDDNNVESLAQQIGKNSADEDWEEFIKPDLINKYKTDILTVSNLIKNAHEEKLTEIFISSKDSQAWYSALNQARLHLENQYNLSKLQDELDPENIPPHLVNPIVKGNFYLHLQSLILEFLDW